MWRSVGGEGGWKERMRRKCGRKMHEKRYQDGKEEEGRGRGEGGKGGRWT